MLIDPRLTEDCQDPELQGDSNRDVGIYAVEAKAALQECTERMRIIRSNKENK